MAGMPVWVSANPRAAVWPTNQSGVRIPSVLVASSKSGDGIGTMDATPTEAEVVALQTAFYFAASDAVYEADVMLSIAAGENPGVQCLLAVVNGADLYADAAELAAYRAVIILPNVPQRIVSNVPITRITIVAAPSSVTSGSFEGIRAHVMGRA